MADANATPGRAVIPDDESKNDKFIRIATLRTTNAMNRISLLSNVFDRSRYDFEPEQAEKMLDALQEQIEIVRAKSIASSKEKPVFAF